MGRPTLALSLVLVGSLAASLAALLFLADVRLVALPLHAVLEASGSCLALVVATLAKLLPDDQPDADLRPWLVAGLAVTGILDAFHAALEPGNGFVWLRTISTLLGGLLFALVCLPSRPGAARATRWVPPAAALAALGLGIASLAAPSVVPAMLAADGEFSPLASGLNAAGGLAFLAAGVGLLRRHRRSGRQETLLFAGQAVLLGLAGLVFPLSRLWSADWWLWHLLRLAGYVLATGYLVAAFRRVERELVEALQVRDDFLAIASHELKTPLTPLSLRLQHLARRLGAERPAEAGLAEAALHHVGQLTSLINDLLDVSRIQAGRLVLHPELVALGPLVREVVEAYRLVSDGHVIELGEPPGEVVVRGDRARLEQVLQNLLDNALKYSPEGGTVHVALGVKGGTATVSVKDPGVGIPEAEQPRLFQRFFRARNAELRHFPGLGLGLYICHDIVERHGGQIRVESRPGEGARFIVELPLVGA